MPYLMIILYFVAVAYHTSIVTGDVEDAGTDANVYMQIFGDKGDTGVIELKDVTDAKLEKGQTCKLALKTTDVGNVRDFRVRSIQKCIAKLTLIVIVFLLSAFKMRYQLYSRWQPLSYFVTSL